MNKFNKSFKSIIIWVVLPILVYAISNNIVNKSTPEDYKTISEFVQMNNKKLIKSVKMGQEKLTAETTKGETISVTYPIFYSVQLIDDLLKKGVEVDFIQPGQPNGGIKTMMVIGQILSWLPMLLMGWVAYSLFKGMNGGNSNNKKGGPGGGLFGSSPFSFGKSKAKMIDSKNLKVSFKDVAGIDEAKNDVAEIVDFLKDPIRYSTIGGIIPKGCLLIGYPGTGKTLLAKAIASEAKVPFFFMSGSDFVEMFVGVGASRVRDLFSQAKRHSPCIVFIDEIDAVGRSRGAGIGGGNDEREQTLNQLLVEMDGFEENNGIVVVAATNRPDVLDPALLRPGRFDRQITISLPDIKGRQQILDVHMKKIKSLPSIDNSVLARGTPGFSGADLANLVNEAALLAARDYKEIVTMAEFENAKDKILMGSARQTAMKQSERELTAYHEGGHALVAVSVPASDPIHKITIMPRGRALGVVIRLPKDDQFSVSLEKMKADIAVSLGGRVAEELVFGHDKVTSGASSDIKQVTEMARSMVVKWGLSSKIGMVNYGEDDKRSYLDKRQSTSYNCSDSTADMIDKEVKHLIDEGYKLAKKILTKRRADLDLIAKTLLEVETLTGDEFDRLLKGENLTKEKQKSVAKSTLSGILLKSLLDSKGDNASNNTSST